MLKSSLPRRVVWSKPFPEFAIWLGVVGVILSALSFILIGVSDLNWWIKIGVCFIVLIAPILVYIIWKDVPVLWQRVKQYDLLYEELELAVSSNQQINEQKQAVPENRDIYLSVCLFRDIKTDEQREQDKRTAKFYIELQEKLESIVHNAGRRVVTRRDFYAVNIINPGLIPDYANAAFDKIMRCKYFVSVIQKLPEEVSGGSHLIEVGYALAKGKPVLCYIEETMYKPMFLRELNKLSRYKLISYSDTNALFTRLEAIDTDFNSIEST